MHPTTYAAAFALGRRDRERGEVSVWLHVTASEEIHAGYMAGWLAGGS